MITAVSMNPSVDRTITVPKFTFGGMNRVSSSRDDAGGKAVNVAVAAARLGAKTRCVGLNWKENGRLLTERLEQAGVETDFLWLDGAVRVNIKLVDGESGLVTEINSSGAKLTEAQVREAEELILRSARESEALVCTGSLPPGCPDDYYARVIGRAKAMGCLCALDAEGKKLAAGIDAKPFLVKPNQFELEGLAGRSLNGLGEIAAAAREIVSAGVEVAVVSMGAEGALAVTADEALFAPRLEIRAVNTVGAGDTMVAGMMTAFCSGADLGEALRTGTAAAAASCMTEGTQLLERETYEALRGKVELIKK